MKKMAACLLAAVLLGIPSAFAAEETDTASTDMASIRVENNTVYANGIPVVVKKDTDGKVYVYDKNGTNKLYETPLSGGITIYGGAKNKDVNGDTYVKVVDISATVYGGGYSDGKDSANVSGNTEVIAVEHSVSDTNKRVTTLYGGGRAEGKEADATANVTGKTLVTLDELPYDPPSSNGHTGTAHQIFGGGSANAQTGKAEATVGSAELNLYGVLYSAFGGGDASASNGQTADADCGAVVMRVKTADPYYVFGGGEASGSAASANVDSVDMMIENSDTTMVYGGGTASGGAQANVLGRVSLSFQDVKITGYVYGGGSADDENSTATAGSVALDVKESVVPAYVQGEGWEPAAAVIYSGGKASGADANAAVGNVQFVMQNTPCAGTIYGGGEAKNGGSATCGNSTVSMTEVTGYQYEESPYEGPYLATVVGGGEVDNTSSAALESAKITVAESTVEAFCGGPLFLHEKTDESGNFVVDKNGNPVYVLTPVDPTYPSKLILDVGASIGMQACIHDIELVGDQTAALPKFSTGEKVTLRGNGHVLAKGINGGGTLTIENTVFRGQPLIWTGKEGETLTVKGCTFEAMQAESCDAAIQANGGRVTLTGNTVTGGGYTSAVQVKDWAELTVQGNVLKNWADNGFALDLQNTAAQNLTVSGNAMQDAPQNAAAYVKLALAADAQADLRKNYWENKNPADAAAVLVETADPTVTCQFTPYFKAAAMRDPQDLSDYVEPSHGGGSSSSGNNQQIEKHEDGSTTITVTDPSTGTVTETTKTPDGAVTQVEKTTDGTVTTTEKQTDGTQVKTVATPEQVTAEVAVPHSGTKTEVTIPVPAVTPGTVAVLVKEDGTREIVRDSLPTEDGVAVTLTGNAKLEIIDNSKPFADVTEDAWYAPAVDFTTARELLKGTGEETFSPALSTTRAMVVTMLYRLENEPDAADVDFADIRQEDWYSDAVAWAAASKVVEGVGEKQFAPEKTITRQELAVMLYRYAGYPAPPNLALTFADADEVSGYAADALRWAIDQGIVTGKPGNRLDPKGGATRAEVAVMLQRYLTKK